jgi:ABC-type dipeptide/oligopeptide/nickel transport system permease subunit
MAKVDRSDRVLDAERQAAAAIAETGGLSQGALVFQRFRKHRIAVVSVIVLIFVIVLAYSSVGVVFGGTGKLIADGTGALRIDGWRIPGWWNKDWYTSYAIANPGGAPTLTLWPFSVGEYPFGQDTLGKDIFARTMRGIQQSLTVMFLAGLLSTIIGTILGAVSGYFRGWLDAVIMRFTDVIIVIPALVLAAVLGRTFGSNAVALGLLLGAISWTGLARLVRGEFLSLREREFVDAARVAGARPPRIIFRHILPNAVGIIIVNTTLLMSATILVETSLSILNFGIKPPDISLGQIVSEYQEAFRTRPWLFWWPGLFIVIIALTVNFIGDGLRDAFDPRQRSLPRAANPLIRILGNFRQGLFPQRVDSAADSSLDDRKSGS